MSWLCYVLVLFLYKLDHIKSLHDEDPLQTVDFTQVSTRVYGTEVVLVDEALDKQRTYKLEDFFWSGSGDENDGVNDYEYDNLWGTESPTTIYKTKTIVSTIFLETIPAKKDNTTCCNTLTTTTVEDINPTPTLSPSDSGDDDDDEFFDADRQFWLLTVLKSDGKDPVIIDLKNSLAKLYKTAFQRHQEKHLGLMAAQARKRRQISNEPVRVYIHNVTKLNGSEEKVQILYHVAIGGKPVDAETASQDMSLVSDDEVQHELGYPFVVKAEPYLKSRTEPQSLAKSKNTWFFIGGTLGITLVLLLIVAFITLGFAKCKKPKAQGIDNRKQIFERGGVEKDDENNKVLLDTPTYINFREQGNQTMDGRPESSSSSTSSRHQSLSSLMHAKKQRTPPKKPPRPKAALTKTAMRIAPELFDSDSSSGKSPTPENYDPGVISPKSYLSMPSVKSFPRGAMPEPLNKVLEPVSVLHLDMPDGEEGNTAFTPYLLRHGSVGAVEDPGVIGPVVWTMTKQRLEHGVSVDEGMNTLKRTRMRQRLYDLFDDTFSLFGSRHQTPEQKSKPPDIKCHSAIDRNIDEKPQTKQRPKTTDPRKIQQRPKPKGAWASTAPSPLVRPVSAPRINTDLILAEGRFKEDDPAVSLIASIKSEIKKCSLPGSTTDLSQC